MFNRKKKPKRPKLTKNDVWGEVADVVGGKRVMDRRGRHIKQVRVPSGVWTIVLDTTTESTGESAQVFTRFRALYAAGRIDFRFRVYRKSVFSDLGKALGMQDIEVGHPGVDRDWIIKSNSEGRVRSVMILPAVAACLSRVKSGRFEARRYKRSLPGVVELRLMLMGVTTDRDVLLSGFAMMTAVLDQLVRSGMTAAIAAGAELK